MKPRFALNLSHDGIGLLHRAKRGWNLVGEATLDDPDLPQTLTMLRETASALEAGGVRSKLIIPDSQILYTTLPDMDGDATGLAPLIREKLEGMTPYDVADLVFDWVRDAGQIHLAVVARETLDEAEAFATEHRFNPVSFVARPQEGQFPGEPFFGQTGLAETLIDPDEGLERDAQPVEIHGRTSLPKDPPSPEQTAVEPEVAPDPEAKPVVEAPKATPAPAVKPVVASKPPEEPQADTALAVATRAPEPALPKPPAPAPETALEIPAELATLPLPTESGEMPATGMLDVLADKSERLHALETGQELTLPGTAEPTAPVAARPSRMPPAPVAAPEFPVFADTATRAVPAGKPRLLGWFLLLIVLLVLAAAGLWTMLGMGRDTVGAPGDITQIQTTALAPQRPDTPALPGDPAGQTPAAPQASRAADADTPLLAALPTDSLPAARITLPETGTLAPALTAPVSPQAPDAAESTQTAPADFPQIETAALDTGQITGDLAAAPERPESELAFVPPLPDPVTPTPEGALSYRGVLVYAGRPPVNVAPRPQRDPEPTPDATPETAAPETAQAPQPNPHLAQFRPVARPGDSAPAQEAETAPAAEAETTPATETDAAVETAPTDENIGGINWAALQQFRPKSRPADTPAALALLAPATEPAAEVEEPTGPVSKLALARSPTPVSRPKNFSQAVQRALKQAQPEVPLAKPVPAAAALKPRNPTVKSVANQATEANAIRLNQLNLIGVYGSTSDRRALVRLPSGRYVKLKIGDRLDGGKVATIGDRELRYVKGGRNIVLSMPKG